MATLTKDWQLIAQTYLGTSGGNLYVRLYARYSEQDITNNRTYVYYQARSYYENSTYIQDNQGTIAVSGSGASYRSAGCTRPTTGESVSVTTEGWVSHNSDGTGSASGSASINFPNWGWSGTASGSFTLPTIPRASGVACSSPNIGDAATITIDKKSSSFTNTVTYKIGSITGTIADKTSNTVLLFPTDSIKEQIYALIPNERKVQGTVYCTTYNGSTKIGDTQSATFNLYAVEDDCKPDISATIVDTNTSVTDITDKFIKYISKPKVTINATAKNSATITNYSINLNDGQTSNLQENTFDTIGSNKITVSITDSRKYPNSKDYPLDMIDYIQLHINTILITRPEGTSNEAILNCDGAYYNGSFTDDVSNTLTATFKYRKSGAIEWTDGGSITPTIENNTFKFIDLSLGNIFDYNEEYQFKIILQDKFMIVGNLDADIITLPKGQEVIAIGDNEVYVYGDLYLNDNKLLIDKLNKIGKSIVLSKKETQSLLANTIADIVWENELYNDTDSKLTKFENKIIVGSGVSKVLIHSKYQNVSTNQKYIYIRKKSTGSDEEQISSVATTNSVLETMAIINVLEGDNIYIQAYSNGSDSTITSASRMWNIFEVVILE